MGAREGGWAWLVVAGVGVTFAVTTGPVVCFWLVFEQWLRDVGAETSDVAFLSGLYLALSYMPGVLARRLLQLFSCRQVCSAGAALCAAGVTFAAFCDSVVFLVVSYSLLQGVGMGLLLPAAYTCLTSHFRRRRTLAVATAQLLAATGSALYPALANHLMQHYGFRGAQAILGAVSLHALAGAACMRAPPPRRPSTAPSSRRPSAPRPYAFGDELAHDYYHRLVRSQDEHRPSIASFPDESASQDDTILEESEDGECRPQTSPFGGAGDRPEVSPRRPAPPGDALVASDAAFRHDFQRPAPVASRPSRRHRRKHSQRRQKPAVSFDARPATYIEAVPEWNPTDNRLDEKEEGKEEDEKEKDENEKEEDEEEWEPPPPPRPLTGRERLAQRRPTGPVRAHFSTQLRQPKETLPPLRRFSRRMSVILLAREDKSTSEEEDEEEEEEDDLILPPPPLPSALRQRRQSMMVQAADAAAAAVSVEITLLRNRSFNVTALGAALALFCDGMWTALAPLHAAAQLEASMGTGAWRVVTAGGAGEVAGRAALVAGSRWAQGRARLVFLAACLISIPLSCTYAWTASALGLAAQAAALGALRGCRQVALPLLFAERFGSAEARFPTVFGLFLLVAGLMHLLLGPFVGLVRDTTGSYPVCLSTLGALLLFCVVPWTVEWLLNPPRVARQSLMPLD